MPSRPVRIVVIGILGAVLACGPTQEATPSSVPATASSSPASSPTEPPIEPPTAAPTSPSASSLAAVGQTDTVWGRIWDAVPDAFPRFPGATAADDAGGDPASARYAVPGGDPQAIATWFQDALETATFSTVGLNGPAEDGSFVIDSVGEGDCRIQTAITPQGDMTFVAVLYGAGCPAP